jgi:hypothetical protein
VSAEIPEPDENNTWRLATPGIDGWTRFDIPERYQRPPDVAAAAH